MLHRCGEHSSKLAPRAAARAAESKALLEAMPAKNATVPSRSLEPVGAAVSMEHAALLARKAREETRAYRKWVRAQSRSSLERLCNWVSSAGVKRLNEVAAKVSLLARSVGELDCLPTSLSAVSVVQWAGPSLTDVERCVGLLARAEHAATAE